MKRILFVLVAGLFAAPSFATILWEAHYNNGTKNADYAASDNVAPWSSQSNTPLLLDGGYTGGAVAPVAADVTNLGYAVGPANGNLNLLSGTFSVRVKPNFSSTSTDVSTVLCLGSGYVQSQYQFIRLYFEGNNRKQWRASIGSINGTTTYTAILSGATTFNAGDWIQIGLSWERSTGNLSFYVNETLTNSTSVGADYWATTGGFVPWALTVGNNQTGSTPYAGQFNGTIDDVVISDVYQDTAIFSRVPEPATMGLLAFGATVALLRRRSK